MAMATSMAWLGAACAFAQDAETGGTSLVKLKPSPQLTWPTAGPESKQEPVFLSGDQISGQTDLQTQVQGQAQLRKRSVIIKADQLQYDQPKDLAKAQGHVRILKDGNLYKGQEMELKVDAFEGFFLNPEFEILRNKGVGTASRVDFLDEKRSIAHNATFTTCRDPGALVAWMPDWIIKATKIEFDSEEEVGRAENGELRFKDVTILAAPALSFPLTDKRKSGVLPPTINLDNINGLDIIAPYYWNLAPNRDLTFIPNLQTKRGLNMGAEFRYLEPDYSGSLRGNWMPSDQLRHQDRWGLSARHNGTLSLDSLNNQPIGMNVLLNRVSDDNYWKDFPRGNGSLTSRLLANDINWNWQGDGIRAQLRTLKWQTLQDSSAPITPPYDKLPNINVRADRRLAGFDVSLEGDYAKFVGNSLMTGQPNAQRSYGIARVSYPWKTSYAFVIPEVQLHTTNYQFDAAVTQAGRYLGALSAQRSVPTYSLDSGLLFDRPVQWMGRSFTQTLEPRARWVKTPYRDQSGLPVYDTALRDFNFSSIWNNNEYVGQDRVSASHTLTLGASSRLLDASTGVQSLHATVAQRLRFSDQNATLPNEAPSTSKVSDLLMGLGLQWNPQWQLESTFQYNQRDNRSTRSTLMARYTPSNYRVVSMAYRMSRDSSEQLDLGWQWPIDDLWRSASDQLSARGQGLGSGRTYTVGRINYSIKDKKMVDALIGIEYDSGCWLSRAFIERIQRSDSTPNNRIMFQLEFVGFSRIGTTPLDILRNQIPGYQFLRERSQVSPNRFTTYE